MDSILDRLDFYENPKCVIWHANVTQVVSFLHILARLPQKVEIASHASAVKLYSFSTAVYTRVASWVDLPPVLTEPNPSDCPIYVSGCIRKANDTI